jgi:DNA-binding XRE family transcriptional regulator
VLFRQILRWSGVFVVYQLKTKGAGSLKLTNEDVKLIRKAFDFSMKEFGQIVGIDASTVCRIESGSLPVSEKTATKICQAFDLDQLNLARI